MGQDFPVADVSRDDDEAGENTAHLGEPVGVLQGTSADNHPLCSIVQRVLNQIGAADSAADLNFRIGSSKNALDLGRIISPARDTVEIDDVKVTEAVLSPGDRDSDGIRNSDNLLIVGSGCELNACTTTKIECRYGDHPTCEGKRARIMTAKVRL